MLLFFQHQRNRYLAKRKLKNEFSFFQLVGYGLVLWSVLRLREDNTNCAQFGVSTSQ